MTYPDKPGSNETHGLKERFGKESVKVLLIGSAFAVEQTIIDLERRGFCDRTCWSKELPIPEAGSAIATHANEVMRIFKRWYPTSDRGSSR